MKGKRDPWPHHCRSALVNAMLEAADVFPHPGEDRAERVHDARKALKKARALARLFTSAENLAAYDVISALDEARRKMGAARNLDVMPDVLKSLTGELDAATCEQLAGAIAFEREVARVAHRETDALALAAQLRALARSIEAWDLALLGSAHLLKSIRASYRSARRLGRKAFEEASPGELHDMRTFVVDLGHQIESVEAAWPALFVAMGKEIQKLRQALGDINDLAILGEFANSRRDMSLARMSNLALKIERRQSRRTRRARPLCARIFAERPGAFEKRIAAYLENSKTGAKALGAFRDSAP
jgi:CHAD domain-containing protein